jgi:hypothetical protein
MEPSRGQSICVPFASAEHYAACVADPESFRQHLMWFVSYRGGFPPDNMAQIPPKPL